MNKKTKIVATIGPVTESYENLKRLGECGVNIFRLNFSHGTHESHRQVIDRIKQLNQETGLHYGIMIDTKGPEIRTGDVPHPFTIHENDTITLTTDTDKPFSQSILTINYKEFPQDVQSGDTILIDNGVITLTVDSIQNTDVLCRVLDGGEIKSKRHVNLPGKDISLPSITEKDWSDIEFAVENDADFIALSFIRSAEDILTIRKFLEEKKSTIQLITKVETLRATQNIDDLFQVSDGIMVARGDLGAEIPFEDVPIIQWEIAKKSAIYKKPVIVATHMLESMIQEPIPTRAEATDVFTATYQRNDAVMLSGETTIGAYPFKAVEAMSRIIKRTEEAYLGKRSIRKLEVETEKESFCQNAWNVIDTLEHIEFIMVLTRSGSTARTMASFRPHEPLFVFADTEKICRNMSLFWGTQSFHIPFSSDPETTIKTAIAHLLRTYPERRGQRFVMLSDILINGTMIKALQIRTLE